MEILKTILREMTPLRTVKKWQCLCVTGVIAVLFLCLFYTHNFEIKSITAIYDWKDEMKTDHGTELLLRNTGITNTSIGTSSPEKVEEGNLATCPFPVLDPWDPAIKMYFKDYPPLNCDKNGKPSVAYLEGKTIKIDEEKVKKKIGSIEYCQYTPLKLSSQNDLTLQPLNWSAKFKTSIEIPDDLEHFLVQCINKGKVVADTYKSRVFEKPKVEERSQKRYEDHVKKHSPAETMSIMIVGIDAMSKSHLKRGMPKAREYLLKTMQAKELNMFNKVGFGTFHNVIVLLTGKPDSYYEHLPGWSIKHNYFDSLDNLFIWNKYQKAGYRTAAFFDMVKGTAFHYLKKGWKQPTFDYYQRPGPLMMDQRSKKWVFDNCVGDQREVSLLQDYYLQLSATFNNTKKKPYFAYTFFTHLTHDYPNQAIMGDHMYLEFFTKLHTSNVLNNTLLIFFSDHGLRFGPIRRTFQGYVEGRSPFFMLRFPPWFEKKYPKEMANFHINLNRLTTSYDVHATMYDLLHFRGKKGPESHTLNGTSLFQEIPRNRTCEDARIPAEYCLCKGVSKAQVSKTLKDKLVSVLLGMMNTRTAKHRNICALLSVKLVHSVTMFKSEFQKSEEEYYQVILQTTPGNGFFEALLNYNKITKSVTLVGDIQRSNLYRGQDGCVDTVALKTFCFCLS